MEALLPRSRLSFTSQFPPHQFFRAKRQPLSCISRTLPTFPDSHTPARGSQIYQEELMARYGTLGDYRFSDTQEAALDIRGANVYGPKDQKLGEIADVVFDEATGAVIFAVVDTGGWLSSKRFVVPLRRFALHCSTRRVSLSI